MKGTTEYLVQWENCSYLQSTYESEASLAHAQRALTEYYAKRRKVEIHVATTLLNDPRRLGMRI